MDTKTENNLIHIESIKPGDLVLLSKHTYKNYSRKQVSICLNCLNTVYLINNVKKEYSRKSIHYFIFDTSCFYCRVKDEYWFHFKNTYPASLVKYIRI